MSSPDPARTSLLSANHRPESGRRLSDPFQFEVATSSLARGTLTVTEHGDVACDFPSPSRACFRRRAVPPAHIPNLELLGARLLAPDQVVLWYSHPSASSASRAHRRAMQSPPLRLVRGPEEAAACVAALRRAAVSTVREWRPSGQDGRDFEHGAAAGLGAAAMGRDGMASFKPETAPSPPSSPPSPSPAQTAALLPTTLPPLRHVWVVVNPASGPGLAPRVCAKHVVPVLEAAGIPFTVHETRGPGDALAFCRALRPTNARFEEGALLGVGGDGTLHEMISGLLGRPDWAQACAIPVLQVPAGSGNALASSAGIWSPASAMHALLKAAPVAMDVASVVQGSAPRRAAFLSLTFGFVSNLDLGTEHLRWLGSGRFIWGALLQVFKHREYAGEVWVVDADGGKEGEANGAAIPAAEKATPSPTWGDGPPLRLVPSSLPSSSLVLPYPWTRLEQDAFQLFAACNLPRLDENFLVAPTAGFSDGCLTLVHQRALGRLKGLHMLYEAEHGRHLRFVHCQKIKAIALVPKCTDTWVVVDGEAAALEPIFLEVHSALCRVIVSPELNSMSA